MTIIKGCPYCKKDLTVKTVQWNVENGVKIVTKVKSDCENKHGYEIAIYYSEILDDAIKIMNT